MFTYIYIYQSYWHIYTYRHICIFQSFKYTYFKIVCTGTRLKRQTSAAKLYSKFSSNPIIFENLLAL